MGFEEKDHVWLYNLNRSRGRSPKLYTNWEGPYTVKKKTNDVVYRFQQEGQRKFNVVHIDRLAKYYYRDSYETLLDSRVDSVASDSRLAV